MIQYIKIGQNFSWSKFDIQSAGVTLKLCSSSPKANHFFPISQWCFYASLVKIHQSFQESADKAHFYILYSVVSLKIRSRSPKSDQIFKLPQRTVYEFWPESFGSRDRVQKSFFIF